MSTNTIDHIHKQFSCPSGAGVSKVIGKNPLSRLFIAFAASLILIACGSSNSDEPTIIEGETNAPLEQADTSQEQVSTPDEQAETNTPLDQTDASEEQVHTPDEQAETTVNTDSPPATEQLPFCLLYTSPSPRDATLSRMPSSA